MQMLKPVPSEQVSTEHVVLLGAGASVEAGLLTSASLTQKIYDDFVKESASGRYARLLGYVISKLQVRNTKRGHSPYRPVDVEELFDALTTLVRRDSFVISEFVERWDRSLDDFNSETDLRKLRGAMRNIVNSVVADGLKRSGRIAGLIGSSSANRDYRALVSALKPRSQFDLSHDEAAEFLHPFLDALVSNLTHQPNAGTYLLPLIQSEQISTIATLNYDLVLEDCCQCAGVSFDYGLDRWAQQHRVRWMPGRELRIMKLHGSINWIGSPDDFEVFAGELPEYASRVMVFGGEGNKLSASGPFLQFLNSFERAILASGSLVVVGYSFRDAHINAILQRWRLTRRDARLTIIDPNDVDLSALGLVDGEIVRRIGGKDVRYRLWLRHLKAGARDGIADFLNQPELAIGAPPAQAVSGQV